MATTGVARAAGYADYSSTGTGGQFIPEIWSLLLTTKLYPNTVFDSITNRNWEGEIRRVGDIVHIRQQPTINSSAYQIGQTLTYQVPTSTPTQLVINQALYWAFQMDTIDMFESDINLLDMFASNAAQSMMVAQDQSLLAVLPAEVGAANAGVNAGAISGNINLGTVGSPVAVSKANAVDALFLAAKQTLDEQNIPFDGQRWIVIPSAIARQLLGSELKFAYETGDAVSPLRNGKIGRVGDFDVYQSNNILPQTDGSLKTFYCPFGWKPGLAWASQFTDNQIVKLVTQAGYGAYSICAYGFNAVVPNYVGVVYVTVFGNYG